MLRSIPLEVPEGKSGPWAVEKFEIDEEGAALFNMRCLINHVPGRCVEVGEYHRLVRGETVIMSNTRAEIRDHAEPIHRARRSGGAVLIHGLGLGMCIAAMLESDAIESITVIEKSPDVIKLVAPTYTTDPRVEVIEADAMTWQPPKGARYTVVWHDIWATISEDNLPMMHTLHRRYGRRCEWQGSWARAECERWR